MSLVAPGAGAGVLSKGAGAKMNQLGVSKSHPAKAGVQVGVTTVQR